jgi:hypothetical protein
MIERASFVTQVTPDVQQYSSVKTDDVELELRQIMALFETWDFSLNSFQNGRIFLA